MAGLSGRLARIEREVAARRPIARREGIALVIIEDDLHCDECGPPRVERQGWTFTVYVPPNLSDRSIEKLLTPEQRTMLIPSFKIVEIRRPKGAR